MKKIFIFLSFFISGSAYAALTVQEAPISDIGTATVVAVSSNTWTKVPTTQSVTRRVGLIINNPDSNTASMYGVLSKNCSTTPAEATSVRPLEFKTAVEFAIIPIPKDICLFLISGAATATENVYVQEISQ